MNNMKLEDIPNLSKMIEYYYADINNYDYHSACNKRDEYIKKYGFVGVCKEFCNSIANLCKDKNVLSVMSGVGYLESILMEYGVNVKATDSKEWIETNNFFSHWKEFIDIEKIDAISAIDKYHDWADIVIMSWPPYRNRIAYMVAKLCMAYNIPLLYIGESIGGCTADDHFYNFIGDYKFDVSWYNHYFQFYSIRDYPILIKWEKSVD